MNKTCQARKSTYGSLTKTKQKNFHNHTDSLKAYVEE